MYFLLKNCVAQSSQLHLAHCNQTNQRGWWSMIAFRLACRHTAPPFLPLHATGALLWNHGGEMEGLRSICCNYETVIVQFLVTSGWIPINSFAQIIRAYFPPQKKVTSTSWIKPCLVLSRSAKIFPDIFTGAFSSNISGKHKAWSRKIVLAPGWTHVCQFQNTPKGISLSCDSSPLERKQAQAPQVCSVTREWAGDRQKYEHGCHCCPMCTPQQSTQWGCRFLPAVF